MEKTSTNQNAAACSLQSIVLEASGSKQGRKYLSPYLIYYGQNIK